MFTLLTLHLTEVVGDLLDFFVRGGGERAMQQLLQLYLHAKLYIFMMWIPI